jgi:hypothetical protein
MYKGSFFDHFMIVFDPRQKGKVQHKLLYVLFIAIDGKTICGTANEEAGKRAVHIVLRLLQNCQAYSSGQTHIRKDIQGYCEDFCMWLETSKIEAEKKEKDEVSKLREEIKEKVSLFKEQLLKDIIFNKIDYNNISSRIDEFGLDPMLYYVIMIV